MTSPGFLEVEPETVVQAGNNTAGTAEDWLAWGRRIGAGFGVADELVQSATIRAAMGEYAGAVVSGANRVGQRVSNLGENTAAAGTAVENADDQAAGELNQHGQGFAQYETLLRRPINSGGPAPVNGNPVPTL